MKKRSDIKKIFGITLVFMMIFSTAAGFGLANEQNSAAGASESDLVNTNAESTAVDVAGTYYGWVYGQVTDEEGNLLENVFIRIGRLSLTVTSASTPAYISYSSERAYIAYSNEDGEYYVSSVAAGVYTLEARKKGYSPYSGVSVKVENAKGTQVDIVLQEVEPGRGSLEGTVYGTDIALSAADVQEYNSADGTTKMHPLKGAKITVCPLDSSTAASLVAATTYTDGDGKYSLKLDPGEYIVTASKEGYTINPLTVTSRDEWHNSKWRKVEIKEGETTIANFYLMGSVARKKMELASSVGGELTVRKIDAPDAQDDKKIEITSYDYSGVAIELTDISSKRLSAKVSRDDEKLGSTIAITVGPEMLDITREYAVKFDGKTISMADDIDDVLNPDDDGLHVEYILTKDANGLHILVSVPRWSEHTITVYEVIEALTGTTAILLYVAFGVIASILFIVPAFKRPYFPIYSRKKKK